MEPMHRRHMLKNVSTGLAALAGLALVPSAAEAVLLRAGPVGNLERAPNAPHVEEAVVVVRPRRRRVCWWRFGRRVCAWR